MLENLQGFQKKIKYINSWSSHEKSSRECENH